MIGEYTNEALAAATARGVVLGNPEQAEINRARAAEQAQALRPHIHRSASRMAADRAVSSQAALKARGIPKLLSKPSRHDPRIGRE